MTDYWKAGSTLTITWMPGESKMLCQDSRMKNHFLQMFLAGTNLLTENVKMSARREYEARQFQSLFLHEKKFLVWFWLFHNMDNNG